MKPTKNRFYCQSSNRVKMLFDSESKALNFMKFNNNAIIEERGKAPNRAYFCISCNGWHLTSIQTLPKEWKSRSDIALEIVDAEKERKRLKNREDRERKKENKIAYSKPVQTVPDEISVAVDGFYKEISYLSLIPNNEILLEAISSIINRIDLLPKDKRKVKELLKYIKTVCKNILKTEDYEKYFK